MSKLSAIFGGGPKLPPAPPPPATREDPAIAARRKEVRQAARQRKGRASTILTDTEDTLGSASVNRPGLRTTALLGG